MLCFQENIDSHPFNPPGFVLDEDFFSRAVFKTPQKTEGNWKSQKGALIDPETFYQKCLPDEEKKNEFLSFKNLCMFLEG